MMMEQKPRRAGLHSLWRRLNGWAAALALLSVLLPGLPVQASCVAMTEDAYRDGADLIVLGTAHLDGPRRPDVPAPRIQVERVFKGDTGLVVQLAPKPPGAPVTSVDFNFQEGGRYLVYLRSGEGGWQTDVCAGTREMPGPLPRAIEAALGEGYPPNPMVPGGMPGLWGRPQRGSGAPAVISLAAVALAGLVFVIRGSMGRSR